jgi:hypothetical protein
MASQEKESTRAQDFFKYSLNKPEITATDLPTLEDADKTKYSSLEKLLNKIDEFSKLMQTLGIKLREEDGDKFFDLTIKKYSSDSNFRIIITSPYLDISNKGRIIFKFRIYVTQGIDREISQTFSVYIADQITFPFSFASHRSNHFGKELSGWYSGERFLANMPLNKETESWGTKFSFNTLQFEECVDDACLVLDKIILNKKGISEWKEDTHSIYNN